MFFFDFNLLINLTTFSCFDALSNLQSCPPISVYSGTNIDSALDSATKSYLGSEITVDNEKEVVSIAFFGNLSRFRYESPIFWICHQ